MTTTDTTATATATTTAATTPTIAVVTMEMQRGICGDLATILPLADAVRDAGAAEAAARLVTAARAAGHTVAHCTFSLPVDRSGLDLSDPLFAPALDDPDYLLIDTPATELLPGLGPEAGDLVSNRHRGLSPFAGTDLDGMLRGAGVEQLIICGVSLNVGVPGLAIEAVNHGYRVTVASDACVGLPRDYGDAVLRNTLRFVGRVATVDELVTGWR